MSRCSTVHCVQLADAVS